MQVEQKHKTPTRTSRRVFAEIPKHAIIDSKFLGKPYEITIFNLAACADIKFRIPRGKIDVNVNFNESVAYIHYEDRVSRILEMNDRLTEATTEQLGQEDKSVIRLPDQRLQTIKKSTGDEIQKGCNFHGFDKRVDNYIKNFGIFVVYNKSGKKEDQFWIMGAIDGTIGLFQYTFDDRNICYHRFFQPLFLGFIKNLPIELLSGMQNCLEDYISTLPDDNEKKSLYIRTLNNIKIALEQTPPSRPDPQ